MQHQERAIVVIHIHTHSILRLHFQIAKKNCFPGAKVHSIHRLELMSHTSQRLTWSDHVPNVRSLLGPYPGPRHASPRGTSSTLALLPPDHCHQAIA
jgi:hypothetical protein